ncbi:conserved hypothetical protein [Candidatus Defluviicoccus seviourii]|uniref:Methyltransferase FkbM domain-containing protein n=1 Tax=Candidatus Defluviicoccus seviourii TaxID=2565273 RepID=A0A564WFM2_9PROT|nr:conserved hypothetical protein [Candidatus Defluviicoccus seviourii]
MMILLRLHEFFRQHPLTRRDPAGAWIRVILWQLRSRLRDEVVVGWLKGTKFAAHRGMTGFTGNIYAGSHEAVDMLFVLHFLRPGDLFGNVGANVGSYTVLASGVAGAETVAFEPDPTTVAKLKRNISLNGLQDSVRVIEAAAGAGSGTVLLTRGRDTMNRVVSDADSDVREVPVTTLDQAFAGHAPTMLKLDVEGFEDQVLEGAAEVLRRDELKVVAIETVTSIAADLLRVYGLVRLQYDPFRRELDLARQRDEASNQLYVRDVESVMARLRGAAPVHVLGQSI